MDEKTVTPELMKDEFLKLFWYKWRNFSKCQREQEISTNKFVFYFSCNLWFCLLIKFVRQEDEGEDTEGFQKLHLEKFWNVLEQRAENGQDTADLEKFFLSMRRYLQI